MTDASRAGLGNRIAPPRFIAFLGVAIAGLGAALHWFDWPRAILIGFDAGAIVFLLSSVALLGKEADAMRRAATRNDANRAVLLGITALVSAVILVAIGVELAQRSAMSPSSIALVIATLLLAWLFSNLVYALHYAHLYYSRADKGGGDARGLEFAGDTKEPDYWDFLYFAFTLGMTFQTSDTAISSGRMRRIVTFHSLAAFIFNIGVLAFTINVLGG